MKKLIVEADDVLVSSDTCKAARSGGNPKSLTLQIHHGGFFTTTPGRSYSGGQVSSVIINDHDEFCLHDLKEMVVKLGYAVNEEMSFHFRIPNLGLDYGLHNLKVDDDVIELSKYAKNYESVMVYVAHETTKKDKQLRHEHIYIDSSPDGKRILKKEWKQVSSNSSSLGDVMNKLPEKQSACSGKGPIVLETAMNPFDGLDDILGEYAPIEKQDNGKQIVVHGGTSSKDVDELLDLEMLLNSDRGELVAKFKVVKVEPENEAEESESTWHDGSGSDLEDLDYDPNDDVGFEDDEHTVEEVDVDMKHFSFTTKTQTATSKAVVEFNEDDLSVTDYDSYGSDLEDNIDSERII